MGCIPSFLCRVYVYAAETHSSLLFPRALTLDRVIWCSQLGFVYHMCEFTRNQTRVDLGRVPSAAQAPLATDLTPQQFETKYGIEPELTFSPLTPADYRAHGRLAVNLKLRSERPRRRFLTNVYSFSP